MPDTTKASTIPSVQWDCFCRMLISNKIIPPVLLTNNLIDNFYQKYCLYFFSILIWSTFTHSKMNLSQTYYMPLHASRISTVVHIFFNKWSYSSQPPFILFNLFMNHFYVQGPVLGAAMTQRWVKECSLPALRELTTSWREDLEIIRILRLTKNSASHRGNREI